VAADRGVFTDRGHAVFRVSSAKAADLRRFLSRHAKSNGIDADTLARLALIDPAGLRPLELPDAAAAALDRRVRACDRLTMAATEHKVRIKDLTRQVMPCTPLTGDLGQADLAVLEHYADPRELLAAGREQLTTLIATASHNHQGAARAEQWIAAAHTALDLYGTHPAMPFTDLAAEIATEVRLLRAISTELAAHAAQRETSYRQSDPAQLARSLPGLARVGGPAMTAVTGRAARFPSAAHFKSYLGLTPRASETGNTDRKGQPLSKAGSRLARTTLIRAANCARTQHPQLAKVYYQQMVERGADHLKACCVVAARLAERLWAVQRRGMPYIICDTDGTPVTFEQAKTIITEQWTVTEDVRRRRRSSKTRAGKAPQQVLTGHDHKDAQGAETRRPSPHRSSATPSRTVKQPRPLTTDPR